MSEPFLDKLIDCLLKEELGGQRPPDLLAAVLARAYPRRRLVWVWASGALAAAAAIVIALTSFFGGGPQQAAPAGGAGAVVLDGKAVPRGTVVSTREAPAALSLGSYASVEVAPRSSLTVEGAPREEAVSLRQGQVSCRVDSNVGTFAVRTPVGTAWAAGTKFTVRLIEEKGGAGAPSKRMAVQVQAGLVLASGAWGRIALGAGEEAALPPKEGAGGVATGVVTAKGDSWIEVKAAGAQKAERYWPRWIGGLPKDGGGPDKEVLAAIAQAKVGGKVEVKWTSDERKRVIGLKVLQATSRPGSSDGGTVTGVVTGRGESWVEVKADCAEKAERYAHRLTGGQSRDGNRADKEVTAQLSKVKAGDRVELKWVADERKRVVSIRVLVPAKETRRAETPATSQRSTR